MQVSISTVREVFRVSIKSVVLVCVAACSDLSSLAGKTALPAGTLDPKLFHTPAGAMALYQAEIAAFQNSKANTAVEIGSSPSQTSLGVLADYIITSGLLSDELQDGGLSATPVVFNGIGVNESVDGRLLPDAMLGGGTTNVYAELQAIRGGANIAIGALRAYYPSASPALSGHMYALKGYAEVMLAELYCSGVPLSTLDFNGDFTYHAGSTTDQIYRDAIAQFDTAISLSSDSSRILNLARVGKGRALLGRGLTDSAALAVAAVPDGFTYQVFIDWTGFVNNSIAVSNAEGGNGLPYITDGVMDTRVTSKIYGTNRYATSLFAPAKYGTATGTFKGTIAPVTVADWIEARLIRAEAALDSGNVSGWLNQLNYLRHNAISPIPPALFTDLNDPVIPSSRIALLLKERAYWLFVSGHRQGDMRRMIRQYGFDTDHIYPTGAYPSGKGIAFYGEDVTMPVPSSVANGTEIYNPLFTGCFSRGA